MTTREPSEWAMRRADVILGGATGIESYPNGIELRNSIALALDAARAEALDEAAKVCLDQRCRWCRDLGDDTSKNHSDCCAYTDDAAAILALKEKPRE